MPGGASFRFWKPFGPSSSTTQPAKSSPELILHLPLNDMAVVAPRRGVDEEPSQLTFSGQLEVIIPPGYGERSIKGLRIVLKSYSILKFDEIVETDVIFEHEIIIPMEDTNKVLKEGTFIMTFQSIYSADFIASDDVSPDAKVIYRLFAQVVGVKSSPPVKEPHTDLSALERHDHRLSFPPRPDVKPLEETLTASRILNIVHNPSPTGGINELDHFSRSFGPDVGVIETRCSAQEFTVAGLMKFEIEFPHPSPKTTIYAIRVSVRQEQVLKSPKDDRSVVTTTTANFISIGKVPSILKPSVETQALWRGIEAGGKDDQRWSNVVHGRFPHSAESRASTMPGFNTPVQLQHALVYEVWYSVAGEASDGSAIEGFGGMRCWRRVHPETFPSCHLTSRILRLPSYDEDLSPPNLSQYINDPCPKCLRKPFDILCDSAHQEICSESGLIPHVDCGEEADRKCSTCSGRRLRVKGTPDHQNFGACACMDWMKWRISGDRDIQEPQQIESGSSDMQRDLQLAQKIDTEERSSKQ